MPCKNQFIPPCRKHAHFIPGGDRQTTRPVLVRAIAATGATLVELHHEDGLVTFGTPENLGPLLAAAQARGVDYRVVLLTPESTAFSHRSVYPQIVADERAARTTGNHQCRHLTSEQLQDRLLGGLAGTLHPGDYGHRRREITAALAAAGTGPVAVSIAAFAASAQRYREGEIDVPGLPLAEYYTTSPEEMNYDPEGPERFNLICPTEPFGLVFGPPAELTAPPEPAETDEEDSIELSP